MRVSTLTKPQKGTTEPERVRVLRLVVWGAIAVVLLAGIVLYFMFGRAVSPLL